MPEENRGGNGSLAARMWKLPLLLAILAKNPVEFCDRVGAVLEGHRDNARPKRVQQSCLSPEEGFGGLAKFIPTPLASFLDELALDEIEKAVSARVSVLRKSAPFGLYFNSDISLARLCYQLCRSLNPRIVLETGVAYGVNSAFLLQALKTNGMGCLWSIDLPPLGKDADNYVGFVIPEPLRRDWSLHRGTSARILPKLLPKIQPIDLFVHDSLHTYGNMNAEFEMVWPFLRPGGVLLADDVHGNAAFDEFAEKVDPLFRLVVKQENKDSMFGILVKQN